MNYDVPRPALSTPSTVSSTSAAAAEAEAEMTQVAAADGLIAPVWDDHNAELFTSHDRHDVMMTSDELHALLTE